MMLHLMIRLLYCGTTRRAILDNPEAATAMGQRGRAAVEERYNWEAESEKLVPLYRSLLSDD